MEPEGPRREDHTVVRRAGKDPSGKKPGLDLVLYLYCARFEEKTCNGLEDEGTPQ